VRFMCYDFHWRTSLPGALYPRPVYERMLRTYPRGVAKLTMALPLYGYDWPRPDDVSIPAAQVVTLGEVAARARAPGARVLWMKDDGELAIVTTGGAGSRMAAVPSFRAIAERAALARAHGVPALAFWHLGCGGLRETFAAVQPGAAGDGDPPSQLYQSWPQLLITWKERVCKVVTAEAGDSFASLAKRHGVSRAKLYRFNEGLTNESIAGKRVYLPIAR